MKQTRFSLLVGGFLLKENPARCYFLPGGMVYSAIPDGSYDMDGGMEI